MGGINLKIGIDIDDTMADTFDYLMPYISEFFNIDIQYLKDNNISYNIFLQIQILLFSCFQENYYMQYYYILYRG